MVETPKVGKIIVEESIAEDAFSSVTLFYLRQSGASVLLGTGLGLIS